MTERHTQPSPRRLQLSSVRDGKILLMLQPPLQRKTVETSLLYVPNFRRHLQANCGRFPNRRSCLHI